MAEMISKFVNNSGLINKKEYEELYNESIINHVDLSNALGKDGLIKQLSKRILEKALQVEMNDHLDQIQVLMH